MYAATAHVRLISAFVTSLLAGRLAPNDTSDGAGMNLLHIGRQVRPHFIYNLFLFLILILLLAEPTV